MKYHCEHFLDESAPMCGDSQTVLAPPEIVVSTRLFVLYVKHPDTKDKICQDCVGWIRKLIDSEPS